MAESSINQNQIEKQALKRCTKCKSEKSLWEFFKRTKSKDGLCNQCKQCMKKYSKKYKKNHKIAIAIKIKQYRLDHAIEIKAQVKNYQKINRVLIGKQQKEYWKKHPTENAINKKRYYENHKKEILVQDKQKYEKNRKTILARVKQYRNSHKTEIATQDKKYRQTEKGKITKRKGRHKRRASKYGNIYEVFDFKEIFERDGYICQLCGKKTRPDYKNPFHSLYPNLDHIVPLSKGGAHTRVNTQCLCHQCNLEKGNTGTGDQLRMFG